MEEPITMTVQQMLEKTVAELNEINVPMAQLESIGIPLARGIMNIRMCINAINEAEQAKAEKEAENENA